MIYYTPLIPSSFASAKIAKLSLPIPMVMSIISLIFPFLASALAPLVGKFIQTRQFGFSVHTVSAYLFSLLPVILIALSFVYGVPTPLLSCSLENQWSHLFQIKDERAVRAIQDTLRCCGLNSMRDRAWPFPSDGVGAEACERTQGWNVRCVDRWRRQECTVAAMLGLANLSNWAFVASISHSDTLHR